ncbi:MAG: alpha/beta hydrolase [Rhodospirillales bacterium]|nr:alpha/beta hydrolase [Rhodospirillales bacterium]
MVPRALLVVTTLLFVTVLGGCASPDIQQPRNETAMPSLNSDHFIAHDGLAIPLRKWMSEDQKPAAVVIAVHGFNDYSNFFDGPGNFLADRGVTTYAFDQRGFGATPAAGIWPGIAALTQDLETIIALVLARHPDTPLYLFGESMGGAVVMVALKKARDLNQTLGIEGVILSAPAVWGREAMPWYQSTALWLSSHIMPRAKLTGQGLKIMASDNIEMLRALGRDPLIIKKTRVDAVYGLTNLMDAALKAAYQIDLPLLILYGEKDEIIPRKPTELMLSRLPETGKVDRQVIFYANGYHMLTRDLQGEAVWRDIDKWISARAG